MNSKAYENPKVVYIVTAAESVRLLSGQLQYVQERGFEVVIISSPGEETKAVADSAGVRTIWIPMQREISLLQDIVSLWRLFTALRWLDPDIVNAATPKAGLLGMLAAWCARVPVRLYTMWGLRLETSIGVKRLILSFTERIASVCAHRIICISESLRGIYVSLGLVSAGKTLVLGPVNGVDVERFSATADTLRQAEVLREQLRIPQVAPVIGFVGRFTRDKGIAELLDAFEKTLSTFPNAQLLLLGRFEEGDPIPINYKQRLQTHPQVILAGYVSNTAPYYHLMNILALPSYREGFPNVVLEAGAARVAVVGFRATGVIDAVVDGETGLLVPIGDSGALAEACVRLLGDDSLRERLGGAARDRVLQRFAPERIWEEWLKLYKRELTLREK